MVVAEVPLWVRHRAAGSSSTAGDSSIAEGADIVESDAARARRAAELWHPTLNKCPVYSIDAHSSYFCTAGGDGTVKVWEMDGLFRGLSGPGRGHVGRIDDQGGYVSGSEDLASHSGDDDEEEDDDDDEDDGAASAANHRAGKGLVVSDEDVGRGQDHDEDDDDDDDESGEESLSSASSHQRGVDAAAAAAAAARSVHDLTGAVRKKTPRGGDAGSFPPSPPRAAAASSVAGPASHSNPSTTRDHLGVAGGIRRRLVTTLSGHSGHSVLAVRFSHNGRYLATGGDDGLVLVYRTTIVAEQVPPHHASNRDDEDENAQEPSQKSQQDGSAAVVYWPRVHMGTGGHELDVVDLCWSPDDSLLVSCSVDSRRPVLVWKIPSPGQPSSGLHLAPYKALSPVHHTSTVRGVTFDPAGSYLATSGDDPAICIWRAHDDWGLERRITDIFYRTPNDDRNAATQQQHQQLPPPPPPPTYHHDPTFVRRLSWSTDGLYIACTNALVKNKHVASTVARQGWSTAGNNNDSNSPEKKGGGSSGSGPGGATLVGHKQPVVACRHCPRLLMHDMDENRSKDTDDDDDDDTKPPKYSTLLALGDRAGFVTVWTTRQSRPVFKLQCASRTTVTDLAWSTRRDGRIVLLVSQLDGAITALLFGRGELPSLLPPRQQARFFALKYGLEWGSPSDWRVAGSGAQQFQFIESALTLLQREEDDNDDTMDFPAGDSDEMDLEDESDRLKSQEPSANVQEVTTTAGGKKRVRPVLLAVGGTTSASATKADSQRLAAEEAKKRKKKSSDPVQDAVEVAEKAAAAAASSAAPSTQDEANGNASPPRSPARGQAPPAVSNLQGSGVAPSTTVPATTMLGARGVVIPHSTSRLRTVDLPLLFDEHPLDDAQLPTSMVAECSNSIKIPAGSSGDSVQCTDIVIRRDGLVTWRDQVPGTHACEIAASISFLAVGTCDGTLYLYGNSPSVGWKSGQAFRSHPPLVIGHPIVRLRLQETKSTGIGNHTAEMLVVAGDGSLAVYELFPNLRLQFKASVLPAMNHMALSCQGLGEIQRIPELSRIQFTKKSGRLLLLLGYTTLERKPANAVGRSMQASSVREADSTAIPRSVGGSIQGFVYDRSLELWMRVSDSRFVLSDFYSGLPSKKIGELSFIDDSVRIGSVNSSIRPGHRGQSHYVNGTSLFHPEGSDPTSYLITRSHCEDRISCSLALKSPDEFKFWLGLYVRTLALAGSSDSVRLVVDMLLRGEPSAHELDCAWWLSNAPTVLGLDRKSLVRSTVLPELRKNLSLQRLTNEISLLV